MITLIINVAAIPVHILCILLQCRLFSSNHRNWNKYKSMSFVYMSLLALALIGWSTFWLAKAVLTVITLL